MLYPNKAKGVAKFNVPLAHMITAGADFMLVPSRFEPCGLIQLHAMRYGTVRILRSLYPFTDFKKKNHKTPKIVTPAGFSLLKIGYLVLT